MLSDSDQKKMMAAILRGQESAGTLKAMIYPTLSPHLDTILYSFSTCLSFLESSSQRSNKKKKKSSGETEEDDFEFHRDDSPTPFLDGYSWRKYGQKTIKDSPFQRSYYRCLGRNCKAKKHVQMIQDSPPIFRTTYVGLHMCQTQVFLHSVQESESSTMIQFEHEEAGQVVDKEHGNDQDFLMKNDDFLMNDDEFWVSDDLEMMLSYNDYGVDSFRL